ncbi:MAG: septal ring lytic transglycosylase RlpA family protein [Bacteroidota bacterium]|nr:septal ring lytic transglycosylase RlpA family protein [Bacteroidota bacterium]
MKLLLLPLLFFSFCQEPETQKVIYQGVASYYHQRFEGRQTSNGEIFSNENLTAAHKTMPFGTIVKVTHLKNGNQVTVRINDRLPLKSTRTIDLTVKAAKELKMIKSGLAKVSIEVIEEPDMNPSDSVE